mmetsp:Transcript_29079/g.83346  ORF Transcript_29079/g.83346 Transcript_29079/m.83346 type:complete len:439 (-) Transcript_29079:37-1353(-)
MPPDMGPAMIFVCQLLHLLPNYYQLNALLVLGRKNEEWTFRSSLLQSQIVAVAAEMCWSALHPATLPDSACALAAVAFACLQGMHLTCAFTAPEGAYHYNLAFPLQLAAALALIPLSQVGNNSSLERRRSPARYKMLGFIASTLVAAAALVWPTMSGPRLAVLSSVVPALVVAALLGLIRPKTQHPVEPTHQADSVQGVATHENSPSVMVERARGEEPETEEVAQGSVQQMVSLECSSAFVVLGCLVGTTGEALMDVATTLAIRESLKKGNQELALTNQCTILISMSMAYFSETRSGAGAPYWGNLFISAWAGCQAFRGTALHLLQTGSLGVPLLVVFAFLDKYTGPLGMAALDTALLRLLKTGAVVSSEGSYGVPGTLLWTARMVVSKIERPVCQLILLHTSGLPVHRVSWAFTTFTCLAVLAVNSGVCNKIRLKEE